MSSRRKNLRPPHYTTTIYADSDFSTDPTNPGRFEIKLDNAIHNARKVQLHDFSMPNTLTSLDNAGLRLSIDEEVYARDTSPTAGLVNAARIAGTTETSVEVLASGNYSVDEHYTRLARAIENAIHVAGGTIDSRVARPDTTVAPFTTNYWRRSDTVTVGEAVNPLEQRTVGATTYNAAGAVINKDVFCPRVEITINKDNKTEIYSNFVLRLRPQAYAGDLIYDNAGHTLGIDTLMDIMGFDTTKQDPGIHEFIPIARLTTTTTTMCRNGEIVSGFEFPYRLTSENVAEFATQRYVMITTPLLNLNTHESIRSRSSHNVLARVPLTNYGSIPTYGSDFFHEHHVDVTVMDTVTIEIKNPDGSTPNFQGVEGVSLVLRVWYDGQ